jgi:large subunit ribosomal protein L30
MLRIKLVKSPIGNTRRNRATVAALGLRKVNQIVEHNDHPSIRGMIHKVKHLLTVEEVEGQRTAAASTPKGTKAAEPKPQPAPKPKAEKKPKAEAAPPAAEEKPKKAKAPKAAAAEEPAADIAPDEPVEAGTEEQPPTEEPVGAGEES